MNEIEWERDVGVHLHVQVQSREPGWALVVVTAWTGALIGLTGAR